MIRLKALSMAAMLIVATPVFAQDDSSSDIAAGYPAAVAASDAVVIKVPVDANGIENTEAAEMRVVSLVDDSTAIEDAFVEGVVVEDEALFDADSDSSTSYGYGCGWSNYRSGYGSGYGSHYGSYSNYRPSYTHYTNTWTYSYSRTYTSYNYGNSRSNYYYYPSSYRTCGGRYSSWGSHW